MVSGISGAVASNLGQVGRRELGGAAQDGSPFGDILADTVAQAGSGERAADSAAAQLAAGDPAVGIHEVMIAAEKANIELHFAVTLKNKVLEAYRELMSTPL